MASPPPHHAADLKKNYTSVKCVNIFLCYLFQFERNSAKYQHEFIGLLFPYELSLVNN